MIFYECAFFFHHARMLVNPTGFQFSRTIFPVGIAVAKAACANHSHALSHIAYARRAGESGVGLGGEQ
jgi:hypothetical protein